MCSHELCLRKLNKPAVVSLRYFYASRCSFSRAITWFNQISGDPSYFDPKDQNTWKTRVFVSSKYHRIEPVFSQNDVYVKSKNTWIKRTKDALSFDISQYYVSSRNIRSEHKFCAFFVHQQRTGASKVELLVHSEVDAEFYGESFGNKT
jgi:hypothetical protein